MCLGSQCHLVHYLPCSALEHQRLLLYFRTGPACGFSSTAAKKCDLKSVKRYVLKKGTIKRRIFTLLCRAGRQARGEVFCGYNSDLSVTLINSAHCASCDKQHCPSWTMECVESETHWLKARSGVHFRWVPDDYFDRDYKVVGRKLWHSVMIV